MNFLSVFRRPALEQQLAVPSSQKRRRARGGGGLGVLVAEYRAALLAAIPVLGTRRHEVLKAACAAVAAAQHRSHAGGDAAHRCGSASFTGSTNASANAEAQPLTWHLRKTAQHWLGTHQCPIIQTAQHRGQLMHQTSLHASSKNLGLHE